MPTPSNSRIVALFAALATWMVSAPSAFAAPVEHPNIILMLIDDMGLMDTSLPFLTDADGRPQKHPLNDWYRTPNMERLAAQGVRFSTFYAQTVCSPTRISILTGQNSTRHRTTNWIKPDANNRGTYGPPDWNWTGLKKDSVTLPRLLQAAGYRTIHIGKAHFGPVGHEGSDPRNLGFDVNIGGSSAGQPGSYYGEKNYGNQPGKTNQPIHAVPHLEKYHGTQTFLTEALTLEAEAQIAGAVKENQPFFLYLPHYAVHGPHQSDPRFAAHYAGSDQSKQAQAYATLIEGMDKSLGDILDYVNQLGIGQNTLIIFLGDNGSDAPLGDQYGHTSSAPLRGKKGTCYEGGTRVPFIAAWAKPDAANPWQQKLPIAVGAIQTQLGTIMDLYPTLLELTGVASPVGHVIDGVSLRPQLAGKTDPQRPDFFLSHFPNDHRSSYFTSLRQGEWKVIYHYLPELDGEDDGGTPNGKRRQAQPPVRYELFNLADDPFETTNLADQQPAQLKTMMLALARQLETEHAFYPVNQVGKELRPRIP